MTSPISPPVGSSHRRPPRIQPPPPGTQRRTKFACTGSGRRQGKQHFQSSPDVLLPKSGRRSIDKHALFRPSGCKLPPSPLCTRSTRTNWRWLGLGRRNPTFQWQTGGPDMHRPDGDLPPPLPPSPPPYPIPPPPVRDIAMSHAIMYGTCQTYRRRGTPSGVRSSTTHTGPVFVFRRRRRRHRAASGMVRQVSVTPGCTYSVCDLPIASGYKGDTPGKERGGEGTGKSELSLFSWLSPHLVKMSNLRR